jgi:hypothetical protein
MNIAVDYTSRIDPDFLLAAGVTDVMRYVSYVPGGTWKNITADEHQELLAAGINVTLNWEWDAHDWLQAPNAVSHAATAIGWAKKFDYPTGSTIVGSADFDMTRHEWDVAGSAYWAQFHHIIATAGYKAGVYGPSDVLQWVADSGRPASCYWQAGMSTAWSSGRNRLRWPGAHLRQLHRTTIGGKEADFNEILIPDWGQQRMATDLNLSQKLPGTESTKNHFQRDVAQWFADWYLVRSLLWGETTMDEAHIPTDAPIRRLLAPEPATVTVVLADADRELLNRAVHALESATPINDDDMAVFDRLDATLATLAAHLK